MIWGALVLCLDRFLTSRAGTISLLEGT
jgi:hypothetical protein